MMTIREYARPATLEEAWQLNQKKPNRVLGGMLWLKMEKIISYKVHKPFQVCFCPYTMLLYHTIRYPKLR